MIGPPKSRIRPMLDNNQMVTAAPPWPRRTEHDEVEDATAEGIREHGIGIACCCHLLSRQPVHQLRLLAQRA